MINIKSSYRNEINSALEKATSFIEYGFANREILLTEASPSINMTNSTNVSSVYIPSYIAHSLGLAKKLGRFSRGVEEILSFLISQMENGGIWRFFGKEERNPPPDFDDTCCVLAVLKENNVEVETDVWRYLLKNKSKTGLYYTWLDDSANRRGNYQTDLAINTNILFFAALYGKKISDIIKNLNHYANKQEFNQFSVYSLSEYQSIYLLGRAYKDGGVELLAPAIKNIITYLSKKQQPDGSWGNCRDTILALTTLINAGYSGELIMKSVEYLLQCQESSGEIRSQAFFRDLKPIYYGSPYLGTSIFLEGISKLLAHI